MALIVTPGAPLATTATPSSMKTAKCVAALRALDEAKLARQRIAAHLRAAGGSVAIEAPSASATAALP